MGTVKAADKDSLPETIFITGMFPLFPFICYITFLHLKNHVLLPESFFKVFR